MRKPFYFGFGLNAERASELISRIYEYLSKIYENEDIINEERFVEEILKMANNVNKKEELIYIGYECGRIIASLTISNIHLRHLFLLELLEEITETGDARTAVYNRMKDAENRFKQNLKVNEDED